jgi:dolichol-phosphate mannosyltransferase
MQSSLPISLAVVTPMANERDSAVEFLRELIAHVSCFRRFEVFVIFDRASTDGTIDLVRAYAREQPAVRVIWAAENRGVVDAYLRGYSEAIASGADWILEIDAGFSHSPAEIPKFIAAIEQGYDCIYGSRFCSGGRMLNPPWKRLAASRGGTILTNLLIGTRLYDMTSGYQMFRRAALEKILANGLRSRGPFFQTEMKIYSRTMKICEIPISYRPTSGPLSNQALGDALFVLLTLFGDRVRGRLASASV